MLFFTAKPRDEALFDAVRAEAMAAADLVVLPHVWEHYDNITHQTLEMCRAAALERRMTHLLKVLAHASLIGFVITADNRCTRYRQLIRAEHDGAMSPLRATAHGASVSEVWN